MAVIQHLLNPLQAVLSVLAHVLEDFCVAPACCFVSSQVCIAYPSRKHSNLLLSIGSRSHRLSRFCHRTFGQVHAMKSLP